MKSIEFERYPEYKESGIEWLKEIPKHWELGRLGTRFTERRTKVSDKDYPALSVTKNGIVPQLESAAKTNDGDNRKLVKKGDFVINSRSDRKGSSGISFEDGSVSLINIVLKPRDIDPLFCNYLLKGTLFVEEFYRVGRGIVADLWTTRYDEMKNIKIGTPPLKEQIAIAKFLDEKCNKIDKAIAQKEKLIELLNERKQVIVQNAVTKGLNPEVEMKESGVGWIGEIPKHWEVKKLKYIGNINPKKSEINISKEKECTFIPMEKLRTDKLNLDEIKIIKDVYNSYTYFKEGDILLAKVTPCFENKNTAIAQNLKNKIGFGSSEIYPIRIKNKNVTRYYFYNLICEKFIRYAQSEMIGSGGLKRIPSTFLMDLEFPTPTYEEQITIVKYLDKILKKINNAVSLQHKQIQKLKEYKEILIDNAVTGKIKVGDQL